MAVKANFANFISSISPNVYYWEQKVAGAQKALDKLKAEAGSSPT